MKAKTKTPAKTKVKVRTAAPEKLEYSRTRTMPAGQFKTHCLSVIDEVHNRREEVVITKHGKPMARLIPLELMKETPDEIFGFMRGKIKILGDIISPVDSIGDWDSEK